MFDPPDDTPGIYIYDTETCDVRRVTTGRDASYMSWSQDGTKLAFARYDPEGSGTLRANSEIFIADLQTGTETQVTFNAEEQEWYPQWSYDGSLVSFEAVRIDQLQNPERRSTLKAASVGQPSEVRTIAKDLRAPDYAWSPVRDEIIVSDRAGLAILNSSAEVLSRIETHSGSPVWAPSGERFAYKCSDNSFCIVGRDGLEKTPVTVPFISDVFYDPAWTPSGDLSFARSRELHVADSESGRPLKTFHGWRGDNVVWVTSDRAAAMMCIPMEQMVAPCPRVWALVDPNTLGTAYLVPVGCGSGSDWSPDRRYLAIGYGGFPAGCG